MTFGLGKLGKTFGDSAISKKIAKAGISSRAGKGFEMLGSRGHMRTMSSAAKMRSGRRRAIGIGGALALNQRIGPSGSRSTARDGIRPKSSGGYA